MNYLLIEQWLSPKVMIFLTKKMTYLIFLYFLEEYYH